MNEEPKNQTDTNVPLEETSLDGSGTGLEAEQITERISAPFEPEKIDVITVPRTIDLLLTRLKEGERHQERDDCRRRRSTTQR